ncbi:MAG: methyltransferase family protein [Roseinatronobacter sp.]
MSTPLVVPFNQRLRIGVLRLAFGIVLPLTVFAETAWRDPEWLCETLEVVGMALVVAGVLGRLWAILYIGGRKNAQVMQDGPYSLCRHPLYLFSTLGLVGFGLMLGSVVLTAIMAGLHLMVVNATAQREEAYLHAAFGPAYAAYAARVPRFWPRFANFRSDSEITVRVATLRSNLRDALVFLLLIPLAEFLEYLHDLAIIPTFSIW